MLNIFSVFLLPSQSESDIIIAEISVERRGKIMDAENRTYYIDGEYDDIVFEIEKELKKHSECGIEPRDITLCAQMIAKFLISQKEDDEDHKYGKGVIIPKMKYYLRFDVSLIIEIARILGRVLACIAGGQNPYSAAASIGEAICTAGIGLNGILRTIPEELFCVLICARQNKREGKYISVNDIKDHLKDCPYSELYNETYGHACRRRRQDDECPLSESDILKSMDRLGSSFGVSKTENKYLYTVG